MSFLRRLLGRKTSEAGKMAIASSQEQAHEADTGVSPAQSLSDMNLSQDGPEEDPTNSIEQAGSAQDHRAAPEHSVQEQDKPDQLVGSPGNRIASKTARLHVGYASDVGALRDHNEDTLVAFQGVHLGDDGSAPFGFFVVTDGMGGHRAGEVASSLAARLVSHEVLSNVYVPYLLKESSGDSMAPLTEVLTNAVQNANDKVHEQVPGGGTTLTCALILGRRAFIAHVGDSRAYLLTSLDIKQVTQDHSYVGRLIELGELSPEEAAVHPQRHVLYRAIGQGENLDIDTFHQALPPGSRLLLCSDGLTGQVSEEEIGRIIAAAASPQEACDYLVEAANAAGGPDNITAVLVETPPD
jgi:protein phosphatase